MAIKKLNPKQKKFCLEYLKHFNASKAALDAGYSKKSHEHIGWELLQKTTVIDFLTTASQKQAKKADISIQWIIQELKQMYERCQSSLSSPGAIAGATRQLELLGKHLGMWIDKVQIDSNLKVLTDDETIKKILEAVKK